MPDTPEHAFTEAGKTLAAELYKSDPWGPAAVAAVEKQAAQRAIDALTAAVENARVEGAAYAEEDNWWGGVEAMRAAVIAILRVPHDA